MAIVTNESINNCVDGFIDDIRELQRENMDLKNIIFDIISCYETMKLEQNRDIAMYHIAKQIEDK